MELYIHIPFCRRKCRYCSFTSFTGQEAYFQRYVDLIVQEARIRRNEISGPLSSVYIGGGTPSLLPPELLSRLIAGLRDVLTLDAVTEFTAEANPGTVAPEWLDTAASLGINRLSFGMQAYQENLLNLLGRIHRFRDVSSSVSLARRSGIRNISLDLIFGIPTQNMDDWRQTVDAALSLSPFHLSAYGLIPEEGTPLTRDLSEGKLSLPDPDEEREMYTFVKKRTCEAGFRQYEISSFALDGYECKHNIGYWTQVPYLGLGVSAASMTCVSFGTDGMSCLRSVNPCTIRAYEDLIAKGSFPAGSEHISPPEARFETMMLGLRMNRGVSEIDFYTRHRLSLDQCYGKKLREMEKRGLVLHENGFWKLTSRGFDIQNSILVDLMES